MIINQHVKVFKPRWSQMPERRDDERNIKNFKIPAGSSFEKSGHYICITENIVKLWFTAVGI